MSKTFWLLLSLQKQSALPLSFAMYFELRAANDECALYWPFFISASDLSLKLCAHTPAGQVIFLMQDSIVFSPPSVSSCENKNSNNPKLFFRTNFSYAYILHIIGMITINIVITWILLSVSWTPSKAKSTGFA